MLTVLLFRVNKMPVWRKLITDFFKLYGVCAILVLKIYRNNLSNFLVIKSLNGYYEIRRTFT
jgi:hypothetical protein